MRIRNLRAPALALVLAAFKAAAQGDIENVVVETYYISDANDATPTVGGTLAEGSRTFRVFLDLAEGRSLRAIYGRTGHPLVFNSTALFFNNEDRGKTYGHQVTNGALDENTTALDSWLSLRAASNARFGVRKSEDADGSNIAGPDNSDGFLVNADPAAGIPLTEADGLVTDTSSAIPPNFVVIGITPDSAFGNLTQAAAFISDSTRIACSTPGVRGITGDNVLLMAQLTTTGDLTFQLNLEIERADGSVVRYVALDTLLAPDETPNGLLSYPPQCGCTDPFFLEYDPAAGCDDGSCLTPIVFGCLDPAACNYDPAANFNIPALCCYGPDSCNGLDPQLVCPGVGVHEELFSADVPVLFPNPVEDMLGIRGMSGAFEVIDPAGRIVMSARPGMQADGTRVLHVAALPPGVYCLRAHAAPGAPLRFVKR